MKALLKFIAAATMLYAPVAAATFHTFQIQELYSNADGTVQYIVLREAFNANGQQFFAGQQIQSTGPGGNKSFGFPSSLPSGATAGRSVLIGTQGFAALGVVTPDYVVPSPFLSLPSGTVNFASVDQLTYSALPTDGVNAFFRDGSVAPNVATNFSGRSGSVTVVAPPPPAVNYQGLWYAAPAESEAGWGINFAHQGDTIFATWFTYDLAGKAWWLSMTATKTAESVYSGQLIQTRGPGYSVPFNSAPVTLTTVGTATLTFTGSGTGTFAYSVTTGGVTVQQQKPIVRQVFGPVPTCTYSAAPDLAAATNMQDLWWNAPAASESGWGINFAHQGNIIFATWFTYDVDGSPLWLFAQTELTATPRLYAGSIYRTTGPPFNAFDPSKFIVTRVGSATLEFSDGNNAAFTYDISGTGLAPSRAVKAITRQTFFPPAATVCQ